MSKRAKFQLQYSGPRGSEFWNAINGIKSEKELHAACIMGCNLQDIEARTLRYINEVTRREKGDRA